MGGKGSGKGKRSGDQGEGQSDVIAAPEGRRSEGSEMDPILEDHSTSRLNKDEKQADRPRTFEPYTRTDSANSQSKNKARMSFTLTPDGSAPDFSAMRENQRELFRRILKSEDAKKQLGIAEEAPAQIPIFTEADVRALYTMLGPVEAYGIALAMKCPVSLASKVFTYTEDDLVLLTQPTLALANKYAAYLGSWAKWKEEITFGMVFIAVTQKKLTMLRHEMIKAKKAQEENPATAPPRIVEIPQAEPVVTESSIVEDGFAVAQTTGVEQ